MFFILGIDAFLEIDTWRDYKKLLEQCHFIVISRPGYKLEEAKDVLDGFYRDRMVHDFDPVKLEKLSMRDHKIFLISIPALDIASKDIRRRVKAGESIAGLVARAVKDYIESNNLYQ